MAWIAEENEICPRCGHPKRVCRDSATQGRWEVTTEVCEASRVLEAVAENAAEKKQRGVVLGSRLTP